MDADRIAQLRADYYEDGKLRSSEMGEVFGALDEARRERDEALQACRHNADWFDEAKQRAEAAAQRVKELEAEVKAVKWLDSQEPDFDLRQHAWKVEQMVIHNDLSTLPLLGKLSDRIEKADQWAETRKGHAEKAGNIGLEAEQFEQLQLILKGESDG